MKKHVTASILSCAVLAASVLSCISCGDTQQEQPADVQTSGTAETTEAVTEEVYQFPALNMEGKDFTILNTHQEYGFYSALDQESTTGDGLDDAVYERNRKLEQQFNFHFKIVNDYLLDAAAKALKTSVLAEDNAYDVAFIRDYYMTQPITEGYVLDMSGCDTLHFDKPWWDSEAIEQTRLGDLRKILYAFTDISLVDFEGTICCFFNDRLLDNLDIEKPYQLVLNGKWTLDRLNEIITAGANLNGDDDFSWNSSGQSVYGMTSWDQCYDALLIGSDLDFFTIDKSNDLTFAVDNEKFYTRALKLVDILGVSGHYIHTTFLTDSHYETAFKNGRAVMMTAQLKASNKYRDMTDTYGIVPIPKYDEAQENYRNLRSYVYVMCIPTTCEKPETVGTVMDAMAYLTYRDIMPYFYESHLSQKLLRDEESIAMLDIIRQTRYVDVGIPFGVADVIRSAFYNVFRNATASSGADFASTVASVRSKIDSMIETAMDTLNQQ